MTADPSSALRLGLLSVPFKGVPPAGPGSIAYIAHEVSQRLAGRHQWTVVGGTWGRAPALEDPRITYRAIPDRLDRWWLDALRAWDPRPGSRRWHPYHRSGFRQAYARRAAAVLRDRECDLVLSFVFPQWLPVLRRALPSARLLHWAEDMTFAAFPERFRDCFRAADGLIACSALVGERMVEAFPSLSGRSWVVPNGFDPETFRPAKEGLPAYSERRRILYAGRITPEKGVGVLVQAFALLARKFEDVELQLVGPSWCSDPRLLPPWDAAVVPQGGFRTDLAEHLKELAGPARDRLVLGGTLSRSALARAFREAAVVVQPSLWEEPFGMPALEAMACGAAVVVTEPGGHAEFVTDGETGCVVPRGDVAQLAEVLTRLLEDPPRRRELGRRAAEHVHAHYTWDHVVGILEPLLTGPGPDPGRT